MKSQGGEGGEGEGSEEERRFLLMAAEVVIDSAFPPQKVCLNTPSHRSTQQVRRDVS